MKKDVTDLLKSLPAEFLKKLPEKQKEIRALTQQLGMGKESTESYESLLLKVHSLVGAAGTFGLPRVSDAGRELEQLLQSLGDPQKISQEEKQLIEDKINLLDEVAQSESKGDAPNLLPARTQRPAGRSPIIHIVEDDVEQAEKIGQVLREDGYQVGIFTAIEQWRELYHSGNEIPDVVLMDMIFPEGDEAGANLISELGVGKDAGIPVIVISVRDDLEGRLAAFRAGACRYLTKPVESRRLLDIVDNITSRQPAKPYRVLLVDDDPVLLEAEAAILAAAGMDVHTVQDPLQILNALDDFIPDVIVLDVYMPGASGPELAAVLRERDAQMHVPILFLSAEKDMTQQLLALNLGGDDFLVKPVKSDHLIAAVTARAKRARQNTTIRQRLETTLYEREREHLALNHHAIVSMADMAGNIIYVNEGFCEISGYSRQELIGENHRLIKSDYHSPEFFKEMWRTIANGNVWHGEVCNRTKKGEYYWVESTIVPFLDEKGNPYQYVSIRTNITRLKQLELEAQGTAERLRRSQVFANIGTWDWNIETGDLYWSERIAPLFGYAVGQLETSYDNFMNAVHPDDRERVSNAVNDCVEKDIPYEIEHRVVWPDGTVRWLFERGAVVRDKDGAPLQMLGVVQDIHDRKITEEELNRFKTTLDMTSDSVFMFSPVNLKFFYVNQGAMEQTGYDYEELQEMTPMDIKPSLSEERFREIIAPLIKNKNKNETLTFESDHQHKSGETHMVEVVMQYIEPEGEPGRFVAIVRNIEERKSMQEKLRRQKALLDMLNQSMTNFVEKGNFNEAMDYMLTALLELTGSEYGFTGEVLFDEDGAPYLKTYALSNIAWNEETLALYNENVETGFEFRNLNTLFGHALTTGETVVSNDPANDPRAGGLPAGHPDMNSFLGVPIYYGDELVGMYGIANRANGYDVEIQNFLKPFDTTYGVMIHSKRMMEKEEYNRTALVEAKETAERASQAKSNFLSSMSHELRTPMNAILGFAQILEYDGELKEEQLDNVHEIIKAGNHLLELINEVLDLAKIESGHLDLSLEPVNLLDLVEECFSLITPVANNYEIDIRHSEIGNYFIRADRTRLKQVLLNLLSNAIKYNQKGGSVELNVELKDENILRISIRDTGMGIEPEKQEELFKPFNRLNAENSEIEGTGIGLAITRSLIEMMGGDIAVESEPGKGSCFWFELPTETFPMKDSAAEDVMTSSVSLQALKEQQHTVLYIEDNPANVKLVSHLLRKRQHISLLTAHEPEFGLELASAHNPNLILLDINMPQMDGYQLLKILQADPQLNSIPVIAITANAMPRDIERGLKAGFIDYLTKPLDVGHFYKVIDLQLGIHESND